MSPITSRPWRAGVALLVAGTLLLAGCFGTDDPDPVDPTGGDGNGGGDGGTGGTGGAGGAGGNGANATGPGGNGTSGEPRVETFDFGGTVNAGLTAPGVASIVQPPTAFPFAVAEGASGILVELRWDQTVNDLDLQLESPDCEDDGACTVDQWNTGGSAGSGDSPAVLRFEPPAGVGNLTGDWVATVWAKAAAAADYEGVVTVFYHQVIPADYTGLS